VLLGLRERGTEVTPCWCREKDYKKAGKHQAYCQNAQALFAPTPKKRELHT
jgi:hypothetical protein